MLPPYNYEKLFRDSVHVHPPPGPALSNSPEISILAERIKAAHQPQAGAIAALWHISFGLLTTYGAANRADLTPMVDLLREVLHQRAVDDGLTEDEVPAALLALQQAGETAAYLHSLPD